MSTGGRLGWAIVISVAAIAGIALAVLRPGRTPDESRCRLFALPEGAKVVSDLPYVSRGDPRQRLDLYIPPGRRVVALVVWIHGGGWEDGDKEDPPVLGFLSDGYALASIDHRLSGDAPFPAQLEDCKSAVRWLRKHGPEQGVSPTRVAVIGESSGGHLAALLGTTSHTREFDRGENLEMSSAVDAVVDFFGPVDLASLSGQRRRVEKLLGVSIDRDPAACFRASPLAWVTRQAAPFLIVHGDRDAVVPLDQSVRLRAALAEAGVPARIERIVGGTHGTATVQNAWPSVRKFIRRFLSNQEMFKRK